MLCSRSASLITSTRRSRPPATIIFRIVSASASVAEADLVQLGDAVDQVRDLEAEVLLGAGERVAGVLDRVVQQRGGERGGVQAEVGEDHRDGERVGDERLAALAALAAVLLLGDRVRALEGRDVGVGVLLARAR